MGDAADRFAACRASFRLDGKVALVLGAASGIGRAAAEAMAALGAHVVCADRNRELVEEVAAELRQQGAGGSAHVVDAAKADDIRALAAAILSKHDRIDVAVTTPAIHVRKLMCDYSDEEYDRVADLNLRGTFRDRRCAHRTDQGACRLKAARGSPDERRQAANRCY